MNHYIAMILKDKQKIQKDMAEAMSIASLPYLQLLSDADKALAALGYTDANQSPLDLFGEKNDLTKTPTIKQRVTQALREQYPDGAHYSNILEYINTKWPHAKVERTSLSPQLTRLRKNDKVIDLDEKKKIWYLVENQSIKNEKAAPPDKENAANSYISTLTRKETNDSQRLFCLKGLMRFVRQFA